MTRRYRIALPLMVSLLGVLPQPLEAQTKKPRLLGLPVDTTMTVKEKARTRLLGLPADTTQKATLMPIYPAAPDRSAGSLLGTPAADGLLGRPAPGGLLGVPAGSAPPAAPEADGLLGVPAAAPSPRAPAPGRLLGVPAEPTEVSAEHSGPAGPIFGFEERRPWMQFMQDQLTHARVRDAREAAASRLRVLFSRKGLSYPAYEIFLRVFKQEQSIEVWARNGPNDPFTQLTAYEVCALSGRLGPKTRQGDFQVPEGYYYIEAFNPTSEFYLSLRLNYPNPADRMRGDTRALGGDIFIHGGCRTVGCLPIEDENIRELYWMAVETRAAGQTVVPVHIFPTRMTDEGIDWLKGQFVPDARLTDFWMSLREGYDAFEKTHRVPVVSMDSTGRYRVVPVAPPDPAAAGQLPPPTEPRRYGPGHTF